MFKARRERLLSDYVPWLDYVTDNMVLCQDGSVFVVLGIDGLPSETIDDAIVNHRHARWEASIRDVAQDGLTFHFLQCRGTADPSIYPQGRFRSPFAEQLDRHYFEKLFGQRAMWLNQTFLVLLLSPRVIGGRPGAFLQRQINRLRPTRTEPPRERIERLRRITAILMEELKDYHPRVLSIVERDRRLFSEIAEAVVFAMTGHWRPVPLTTGSAGSIFCEEVFVGRESFEIRMPHRSSWGACLDMAEFPYMTEPGLFDRFLGASYRHTVMHAWRYMPSTSGQDFAIKQQKSFRRSGDRAIEQGAELTQAANLIAGNRLALGQHANALTVFADSYPALQPVIELAWGDLSTGGARSERCSVALEGVLFSKVPGNFHLRGRQAAVSSRNFAAFAAMHNFPTGDRRGYWGGPIALFRTSGGTPFLFHFHVGGVGNTLITGKTGSGKTTIIGFLICQAERAEAQVILWDKDRGLEALVRALGGSYLSLTNVAGLGTGLAPLKRLTDSPDDLAFLSGLIRACIATPEPYNLTPEEGRRLAIALRHVMRLPPAARSLSEVRAFLGTARDGAGARLEAWCDGAEFGWVIDCPRDIIALDGRVIGFDQSALLDDPIASGAVMATLFHYTGQLVDGRRLLFVLDEVWKALEIRQFQGAIKNGLKTWRKYNSPILIGTQEVSDGLNSPIGDTIRSQCPSQMHFSNPGAHWKDYGDLGLNMTETEFDIVKKLPEGTGHFLLRQGAGRSCVVQVPLSGMSEVRVISGTRRGADALLLARERTGDATGLELVDAYHKASEELTA